MNQILFILLVLIAILNPVIARSDGGNAPGDLSGRGDADSAQPVDPQEEDYYDRTLPSRVPVAPFDGQRYEAEVPDTVDLALYAERALNAATRLYSPEMDDSICQLMHFGVNPSVLEVGMSSLNCIQAKWVSALPLLRVMTGSNYNIDVDGTLIGALVRITGKDGLIYQPVKDRPWAFFDPVTAAVGKPFADVFMEGVQVRAYAAWYEHDKNPLWPRLIQKKIDRLMELSVTKGDTRYFMRNRGFDPWYKESGTGPMVTLGDVGVVYPDLTGGAVAFQVGWTPQALATWYRLTGYEPALELARGLSYFLYEGGLLEENTGRFLVEHTITAHALMAVLSYAVTVQDRELIKWIKGGFDWWVKLNDADRTGIIMGVDSAEISDMIQMAIMLSQAGAGNYWEEADRWVRNSFLDNQIQSQDVERVKKQPLSLAGDPDATATIAVLSWANTHLGTTLSLSQPLPPGSGLFQPDDGVDRCLGAWFATLGYRDAGCGHECSNSWRTLYYVWDNIVEPLDDGLRVNLLLNRASPWADIDSYIPHEGKVEIRMKVPRSHVLVRMPPWTNWNQISCRVNNKDRAYTWSDDYIRIGPVASGDRIIVEFPVTPWVVSADVPTSGRMMPSQLSNIETKPCQITLKGNTIIGIEGDIAYPLFLHEKFGAEHAGTRKVTRFVSQERFFW